MTQNTTACQKSYSKMHSDDFATLSREHSKVNNNVTNYEAFLWFEKYLAYNFNKSALRTDSLRCLTPTWSGEPLSMYLSSAFDNRSSNLDRLLRLVEQLLPVLCFFGEGSADESSALANSGCRFPA